MRKKLLAVILLLCCTAAAFSQARPRLGILPFAGGTSRDGETIARLFSFQPEINETFTVVDRTSAVNAIIAEQNFQMAGYTDSDTIARLGRMLNADYVVSGHIRRLGDRNLVIATIINVETFEQLAGDFRAYRNIEEIRDLLPAMSQKLTAALRRNTLRLPGLAVAPFSIATAGVNRRDAETLAQILAIEIANTGAYAVLPRTTTIQAALQELEFQQQGHTAEEEAKRVGQAINADFVISAEVRSLGAMNMFTAQILHVEEGRQVARGARDYRIVVDGIRLMEELALLLTDPVNADARIAALQRERLRAAPLSDPSKLWSLGLTAGTSFADPWLTATVRGTLAPLRYSFFEIGLDVGFISGVEDARYYSLYPFINYALFLPFAKSGGWYAGIGGGFMLAEYRLDDLSESRKLPAMNFTTGFNLGNFFDISYTLRTDFATASNKIAVGFSYRFKER